MDAQQFLAEFGHIANAPGGVARLRALVLNLAMRGQLVPQDSNDAPASELLNAINAERHRLVKKGKIKSSKLLSTIKPEVVTHVLPEGWDWVRLEGISEINGGFAFKSTEYVNNGVRVIRISDFDERGFKNEKIVRYSFSSELENYQLERNNILMAMTGGTVGKSLLVEELPEEMFVNQRVATIKLYPYVLPAYVNNVIQTDLAQSIIQNAKNSTNDNISIADIKGLLISLPPLAEQSRIVAKVDELMALCDKLETQQQQRRNLQNNLRLSILQAVAASTSPQELQANWMRLADNFGQLFQAPEDIDDFVANLKDLAVLGLSAKVTSDQPDLSEIISACSALRSEYVSAGLMRKQKLILNVEPVELNYPEHWSVVPFDEVAVVIGGVTKGRDLRSKDVVTCPYLSVANVQRGFFKLDQLKSIQITKAELTKYQVLEGDLLITEGGDWDKVGRTAIWKGGIDNCLHQNHVFKARVPSELLLNEWVELIFNSGIGRNYFAGASKQTTNLASINMTQLRSFPLPIPPLAEQRNILKNLDALTTFCQSWRNQLEHKQQLAALLATAVTSSFTGIRTQEEEQPLKAPKTELIASLRLGTPPSTKEQAPLAAILAHQNGEMAAKDLWQRFGGEIDAFYAQLKLEVDKGWIQEPEMANMRQLETA